jgi:hypothetical protein
MSVTLNQELVRWVHETLILYSRVMFRYLDVGLTPIPSPPTLGTWAGQMVAWCKHCWSGVGA